MPSPSARIYRVFNADALGALLLLFFSFPALIFSVFLTVLKFRMENRCDGFLQATCGQSCATALSDPMALFWGLPLTVYATAYYFVLTLFALAVGAWPRELAPAARLPVLVLALAGLAVSVRLALYSWQELGGLCSHCIFLYTASIGVFVAALTLHQAGLVSGLRRMTSVGVMVILVAIMAFAAVVLVQRRLLDQATQALRGPNRKDDPSCAQRALQELPATNFKVESDTPPQLVVALFIDLACSHCKKELKFWREYQRAHPDTIQLEIFHFSADPACGPLSVPNLRRNQSCNAALAAECLHDIKGGTGVEHLERLFAMQSEAEPHFSRERLAQLGQELGVPDLLTCMDDDSVRQRVRRHVLFGLSQGLSAPPSALLVPFKRQGRRNRSLGYGVGLEGSQKSVDYINSKIDEVLSGRK